MPQVPTEFIGRWLHEGDWKGKEFSHALPHYDHDEQPGGTGATAMRHTLIAHDGDSVGVWVPAHWTDDQAAEALSENW